MSPTLKSPVCSAAKRAEIDDAARLNSETHVTDTVKTVEVRASQIVIYSTYLVDNIYTYLRISRCATRSRSTATSTLTT